MKASVIGKLEYFNPAGSVKDRIALQMILDAEEQGLLKPGRNSQNGYREYGEPEVELLRQIKLLRKLGVPLEEIRQMQHGAYTVGDGMRRHLVSLERERQNLERSMELCRTLKDWEQRLEALEADGLLERMEEMRQTLERLNSKIDRYEQTVAVAEQKLRRE